MRIAEASLAGAMDVLRAQAQALNAYNELIAVLRTANPPQQLRKKAKKAFVYDQTELIKEVRAELQTRGWKREVLFAPESRSEQILIRRVSADTLKDGVHAIFEFGNRSYYAYNLTTRVAFGFSTRSTVLAVFVLPSHRFAAAIDSNVVSFEQVVAELGRLCTALPHMIPGPTMIVGLEP